MTHQIVKVYELDSMLPDRSFFLCYSPDYSWAIKREYENNREVYRLYELTEDGIIPYRKLSPTEALVFDNGYFVSKYDFPDATIENVGRGVSWFLLVIAGILVLAVLILLVLAIPVMIQDNINFILGLV